MAVTANPQMEHFAQSLQEGHIQREAQRQQDMRYWEERTQTILHTPINLKLV